VESEAYVAEPGPAEVPTARRGWPIAGAAAAGVVSLGLIWWLAVPHEPAPVQVAPIRAPAPAAIPKAPAAADPAQVGRAFEAVQDTFADSGPEGLARADADCAAALKADGRVLDYCLAFDLFAAAVAPQVARAEPQTAWLAAAREALPAGVDPAARLAAVRSLMRQASLGEEPRAERPAPRPVKASAPQRPAASAPERQARRRAAARVLHAAFTRKPPADACAGRPTVADRLLCGDAKVWAADGRMRRAYEAALAAGVDPLKVDAAQARFHEARDSAKDAAAVEALYDQRTRELEDLSAPH
jgi:hypothetical protein